MKIVPVNPGRPEVAIPLNLPLTATRPDIMTDSQTEIYTLYCYVVGDATAFPIKISRAETVGILKEEINASSGDQRGQNTQNRDHREQLDESETGRRAPATARAESAARQSGLSGGGACDRGRGAETKVHGFA